MKKLINRVLKEWANHPRLLALNQHALRERIATDIVNNMRANPNGNGWFLDLSSDHMRQTVNPDNK